MRSIQTKSRNRKSACITSSEPGAWSRNWVRLLALFLLLLTYSSFVLVFIYVKSLSKHSSFSQHSLFPALLSFVYQGQGVRGSLCSFFMPSAEKDKPLGSVCSRGGSRVRQSAVSVFLTRVTSVILLSQMWRLSKHSWDSGVRLHRHSNRTSGCHLTKRFQGWID